MEESRVAAVALVAVDVDARSRSGAHKVALARGLAMGKWASTRSHSAAVPTQHLRQANIPMITCLSQTVHL